MKTKQVIIEVGPGKYLSFWSNNLHITYFRYKAERFDNSKDAELFLQNSCKHLKIKNYKIIEYEKP